MEGNKITRKAHKNKVDAVNARRRHSITFLSDVMEKIPGDR